MSSIILDAPLPAARGALRAASVFNLISASVCVLATLSFFLLALPTFQWFSDYWEHASALRVLAENPLAPTNPHYASFDSDRQFIPMFIALGWLMQLSGISVYAALAIAGTLTTILFFGGCALFARSYFRHPWAPAVTVCVLLFCWGTPWIWTGFYELRALFYNNFYPASFVLSLTFFFWALVLRMLGQSALKLPEAAALLSLSALMFVSHQLGALFATGGAMLFLLFDGRGASLPARARIVVVIVAGIGLTWWWPYFNPIELTLYGAGDKENEGMPQFYEPLKILLLIGPALLGLPVLYGMARKRIHTAIVLGFVSLFLVYAVGGMAGHPVAHRFLSYAILYLHLAIVWKVLSFLPAEEALPLAWLKGTATRRIAVLLAILLACMHIAFSMVDFTRLAYEKVTGKSFGSFPNHPIPTELAIVAEAIPDDAILFTTTEPALAITALKGKVIARPRPQLMIADGPARSRDNRDFFASGTSDAMRRALIRKYDASHILIRKENIPADVEMALRGFGTRVPTEGQLVLIKIDEVNR